METRLLANVGIGLLAGSIYVIDGWRRAPRGHGARPARIANSPKLRALIYLVAGGGFAALSTYLSAEQDEGRFALEYVCGVVAGALATLAILTLVALVTARRRLSAVSPDGTDWGLPLQLAVAVLEGGWSHFESRLDAELLSAPELQKSAKAEAERLRSALSEKEDELAARIEDSERYRIQRDYICRLLVPVIDDAVTQSQTSTSVGIFVVLAEKAIEMLLRMFFEEERELTHYRASLYCGDRGASILYFLVGACPHEFRHSENPLPREGTLVGQALTNRQKVFEWRRGSSASPTFLERPGQRYSAVASIGLQSLTGDRPQVDAVLSIDATHESVLRDNPFRRKIFWNFAQVLDDLLTLFQVRWETVEPWLAEHHPRRLED